MPFYSWSFSGALSFSDLVSVYCVFDSGIQTDVSSASATFDATAPVACTTFGIYAHFFSAGDTPPISGTGYFVPPANPDPAGRGLETPAFGSGHWPAAGGQVVDPAPPHQRVQVYVYPRGSGTTVPKSFNLALSGAWGGSLSPSTYCAYGTQANPSAKPIIFVTSAIIDAAIALAGGGLLMATAFDVMIGMPILLESTCDVPPSPFPTFTTDDFVPGTAIWSPSSFGKRLDWLKTAIWSVYCECVPASGGAPPAIPYPQPLVDPTGPAAGLPVDPIVCDATAICSLLNAVQRQLNGQGQLLQYLWTDVQLIQRQGVPFGYVHGAVHGGLTGSGDFGISDILGLEVNFTTLPPMPTHSAGDPDTYHQIGKVSLGTSDGWRRSWMPTHNPYLIFPIAGAFTRVGYTLPPGAVVTITELLREP